MTRPLWSGSRIRTSSSRNSTDSASPHPATSSKRPAAREWAGSPSAKAAPAAAISASSRHARRRGRTVYYQEHVEGRPVSALFAGNGSKRIACSASASNGRSRPHAALGAMAARRAQPPPGDREDGDGRGSRALDRSVRYRWASPQPISWSDGDECLAAGDQSACPAPRSIFSTATPHAARRTPSRAVLKRRLPDGASAISQAPWPRPSSYATSADHRATSR